MLKHVTALSIVIPLARWHDVVFIYLDACKSKHLNKLFIVVALLFINDLANAQELIFFIMTFKYEGCQVFFKKTLTLPIWPPLPSPYCPHSILFTI